MDELDPKHEAIKNNERAIRELEQAVQIVDWTKMRPTSNELVSIAGYHKELLTESWLKDIDFRFQMDRITSLTGLTEHEVNQLVEIGGWLMLDRRLESVPLEEREKFWTMMSTVEEAIGTMEDDASIKARAVERAAQRQKEIDTLNKLFRGER